MKRILLCTFVISLLLSTLVLSICAPKAAAAQVPKSVVLASNPTGSTFYIFAAGIAKVAGQHQPILVKHMASEGPGAWLPMLATGEVQFGIQNIVDAGFAYRGTFGYKEAYPNLRMAFIVLYNTYAMGVRANSDMRRIQDLRGKRIGSDYKAHLGTVLLLEASLANGGLTWADVVKVPTLSAISAMKEATEGRLDSAYYSIGSSHIKELEARHGARIIPYDQSPEAVARTKKACPGVDIVPALEDSTGVKKGDGLMAININLMTSENVSEEVVYHMVKAVWENYKELKPIHPAFETTTQERMLSTLATVPYHPGAIKFYKEKGVWTSKMEELQKDLFKR